MTRRLRRVAPFLCLALTLVVAGCALPRATTAQVEMTLTPVSFSQIPGWSADRLSQALPAFLQDCTRFSLSPPDLALGGEGLAKRMAGQGADWRAACTAARDVKPDDDAAARNFFETYLTPYTVSAAGAQSALFTGYFEPEMKGAERRGGAYQTPILRRPDDLEQVDLGDFASDLKGRTTAGRISGDQLVPYYSRTEIEQGVLDGQNLALAWLADPVDAFVLQIQGSGRIDLPDGDVMRVGYAAKNGRPYVPIGRILIQRGALRSDEVSLQSIRAWLEAHPSEAQAVMDQNPNYVFFRVVEGLSPDQGAPGALGVPLTPGRSLAVDNTAIPLGAPVFVDTTDTLSGTKLQRLLIAQDLGGAIKTPLRGDIFFGWGAQAEKQAGHMRSHGTEYVLLPRPTATKTAAAR